MAVTRVPKCIVQSNEKQYCRSCKSGGLMHCLYLFRYDGYIHRRMTSFTAALHAEAPLICKGSANKLFGSVPAPLCQPSSQLYGVSTAKIPTLLPAQPSSSTGSENASSTASFITSSPASRVLPALRSERSRIQSQQV